MSSIPTIDRLIPRFDHLKWKMAAAGVAVGLISGLLVVVYRLGIEYGTDCARWMYAQIRNQPWLLVPWMAAAAGSALLIAWMVDKEPMAGGSGIPQTNGVVIDGLKMRWQSILPVRFVGGLLGSLFGLSLGREGPSIQIGASGAQFLSHRLRGRRREDAQEHYLVSAGAAAGLSAAFSAPLSGMMFALEGIHRSFSPTILMGATAASLTADFVSKYCFGLRPVLDFGAVGQLPLAEYIWLIPLGIVAGLVGSLGEPFPAWIADVIWQAACVDSPDGCHRDRVAGRHLAAGRAWRRIESHRIVRKGRIGHWYVVHIVCGEDDFHQHQFWFRYPRWHFHADSGNRLIGWWHLRRGCTSVLRIAVAVRGCVRGLCDDGYVGRFRKDSDYFDFAGCRDVGYVDAHAADCGIGLHRASCLRFAAYQADLWRTVGTVYEGARHGINRCEPGRQRCDGTSAGDGCRSGGQART